MADPITVGFRSERGHSHGQPLRQTVTVAMASPMDPRIRWFRAMERFTVGSSRSRYDPIDPRWPTIGPSSRLSGRYQKIGHRNPDSPFRPIYELQ